MPLSIRTCMHSYQMHQIESKYNPEIKNNTLHGQYREQGTDSQLQQVEINRAGQPLTKIILILFYLTSPQQMWGREATTA